MRNFPISFDVLEEIRSRRNETHFSIKVSVEKTVEEIEGKQRVDEKRRLTEKFRRFGRVLKNNFFRRKIFDCF